MRVIRRLSRRTRRGGPGDHVRGVVVLAAVLVAVLAVTFSPRAAQDPAYHAFADRRSLLDVPNACDVLSNLAFTVVGVLGLVVVAMRRAAFVHPRERAPWIVLFVAVIATSVGSAYYHLAPANETLVWDRLSMAVAFTSLVAILVMERVSVSLGARLLVPLISAGLGTVLYWWVTEAHGVGDLRPYLLVQYGAMAAVPFLLALYPARYTRAGRWILALLLYVAAKMLEAADTRVLAATGFVSGHTLKHLAAATAIGVLASMLVAREPWFLRASIWRGNVAPRDARSRLAPEAHASSARRA